MSFFSKKNTNTELKFVEKLADILSKNDFADIEVKTKNFSIKINRKVKATENYTTYVPANTSVNNSGKNTADTIEPVLETSSQKTKNDEASNFVAADILHSPMVGTVYLAPSPDSKEFVQVGMAVTKGQTIVIVEAMKTMNHIAAHKDGIIKAILVVNEQPIEYNEKLAIIE